MPKKSAKNNELLKSIKNNASPQMYNLVLDLVNENREENAETVLKVDYLIDYANTCIRDKDFEEANEILKKAAARVDMLKGQGVNTEYLEYLIDGIKKKIKR